MEGLRKRHTTSKDEYEIVGDDETNSSHDRTKVKLLVAEEENTTASSLSNVPSIETEEVLTSADSLYGSTCSSGEFYECLGSVSAHYKVKIKKIQEALKEPIDRELLRDLARSEGGLLNDVIRRRVWPELLDINDEDTIFCASDDAIEKHKEYHQVVLDVSRSLKRFPPGISDFERKILQEQLLKLILSVIIKHPYLSYYQGYHDVAVTLLLVVGDEKESSASGDEDETEDFAESVSSNNVGFEESNGLKILRDPILKHSLNLGVNEEKSDFADEISVDDKKAVEGSEDIVNSVELTGRKTKSETIVTKDDIKGINQSNVDGTTALGGENPLNYIKGETDIEITKLEDDTSRKIVNGTKVRAASDDESESNFGETSEQDWEFTISENDKLDSASSEHLVSMWCNGVALKMLEHVSLNHFRDCMQRTMDATCHLLHHVFPIVKRENKELCDYLDKSGVGTMFCLPWVLTWFSHNVNNHNIVVRLYDYFLASPVASPLYIAAAIILHRRAEIFQTECEMPALHGLMSQIPDDLPFEKVLLKASKLYKDYPPESLKKDVDERLNRDLKQIEERRKENAMRANPMNPALVPWRLFGLLPPQYANRLVPWFIAPNRVWWLTRIIPSAHLGRRFAMAAISIAAYYAYSHLSTNTSG